MVDPPSVLVATCHPLWAVRRWPSVWAAGAASGVALLGLLVPARTFQTNYLVLVAALVPLGWLATAAPDRGAGTNGVQSQLVPAT